MSAARRPVVVDIDDLEEYAIPRTVRLDGNSFVKWQHLRWLRSKTFRRATYEVQGMARALFDLAQNESPIGTLPDDDDDLADMLKLPVSRLRELRNMEFGPLRNWRPCLSDGERRLMHPVVLEQVLDVLERREMHELSKEDKAYYQRLKRLREALKKIGLCDAAVADDVLISRMDDWLKDHCKGNRKQPHYEAALEHAVRSGWTDKGARRG
jgi:hypothetical protein